MTDSMGFLSIILYILLGLMFVLFAVLAFIFINKKIKDMNAREEEKNKELNQNNIQQKTNKNFSINSIFDFMEFDKVEDNMIIQKKGKRFIMVIECQGINYDLMSEAEKISVEEGFVQFLNTLTSPIQIYTQTRKINLESSIQIYKKELEKLEIEFNKQKAEYTKIVNSINITESQRKKALYDFTRQKNLYEYGKDIIFNTEKMSLNKNILNKKYYIVIPYFSEEAVSGNYGKEEIRELAFSELYTQAQSIIRALSISGVMGKVMSSTELVDLLYFAYNREDAESYGTQKALKAGYDELYSTAPDYIDKRMELLNKQIENEAIKLAETKIAQAQTEKQKEYLRRIETEEDIINNLAQLIIEENESIIGKDISEKAKEKVRKEKK